MSDHERGAYTPPTDAPLAFESRRPVRGASPFPLTLVASLLVLIGLAAAIFVFYRSGVRQGSRPPQAVGQPVGALKEAAPPDAQPQDAAQGLQIYRAEAGQPPQPVEARPQFTAPPEQPAPRPQTQAATPTPAATPAPAAAPTTPIASAPAPVLRAAQEAPPPAAAPARLAEAKPKATTAEKPPAAKPPRERAAKPAAGKPAAKAEKAEAPTPAGKGGAAVQIGAVGSPQLADRTWNEAVAAAPGLAAGKGKGVEPVEKGGKTLYRTSVTGFASRAQAQAFCARLKAAGKACFVK